MGTQIRCGSFFTRYSDAVSFNRRLFFGIVDALVMSTAQDGNEQISDDAQVAQSEAGVIKLTKLLRYVDGGGNDLEQSILILWELCAGAGLRTCSAHQHASQVV